MTNKAFHRLFWGPPRKSEGRITSKDMDIARSVQEVVEEVVLRMSRYVHNQTGQKKLCLAGGVALNCVANGRILREGPFHELWVQPAAGDAGAALGAALFAWHQYLGHEREADEKTDMMSGSYLGPDFSDQTIQEFLDKEGVSYETLKQDDLVNQVVELIAQEKVVGWFQGRMEFGPRALGNRSILGDARSEKIQELMNLKIKFRESFRPFAPSVLRERAQDFFEIESQSPYMLLVAPVKLQVRCDVSSGEASLKGLDKLSVVRSKIPAVTHVDFSARIQTVDQADNPLFFKLLKRFDERFACPVVVNTSFNVRGEPIVCTPEDAYQCFMRTNMDYLAIGSFLIKKTAQIALDKDVHWLREFALD